MLGFSSRHELARNAEDGALTAVDAHGWEKPVMDSRELEPVAERRSSTSIAPPRPPRADCLLTIGAQCLAAVLAEEADAGLHVLIQGSPLFWVEDTGVLQTTDVEIAVRVSTIVCMEADQDDFASSLPAFRIGLARLDQPAAKTAIPVDGESARKRPPQAPFPFAADHEYLVPGNPFIGGRPVGVFLDRDTAGFGRRGLAKSRPPGGHR